MEKQPAEELLQAANTLLAAAREATTGPWKVHGRWDDTEVRQVRDDLVGGRFNQIAALNGWNEASEEGADHHNARYIAMMDPLVGIAVADRMAFVAGEHDGDGPEGCDDCKRWLPLARLINGRN